MQCERYLFKFGGHKYAAGLSLKKENIQAFMIAFEKVVLDTITEEQLTPEIFIDLEIQLHQINDKLFRIVQQFAPFGPKNMMPIFISKGVSDSGYGSKVGADKTHLRLNIISEERSKSISSIGFGLAHHFDKTNNGKSFDICYSIEENNWNERKNLQLKIRDIKANI